jgi:phosphoserine phosphatase
MYQPPVWPIARLVIFDCDSTLSAIEGIDELARLVAGEDERVPIQIAALTKRAMEGDIPLEAVYGQRLLAVRPTRAQVGAIAGLYRERAIAGAGAVIAALQALGAAVFIVSGGLIEPLRDFGVSLGVPRERIFAVGMHYDQLSGRWWRYWDQPGGQNPQTNYLAVESNPLTGSGGKNQVIAGLRSGHPGRAILVGDGLSDLEASGEVDLFIGFGGAVHRGRIAEGSPIYIHTPSLAPVLPLALGQLGSASPYTALWVEGLRRIHAGEVSFQDEELREAFLGSLRRPLRPKG